MTIYEALVTDAIHSLTKPAPGQSVEIVLPLLGPLSVAYKYNWGINIDNVDNVNLHGDMTLGTLTQRLTVIDAGNYPNPSAYLKQWAWDYFIRDHFVRAVAIALLREDYLQLEKAVRTSLRCRLRVAWEHFRCGTSVPETVHIAVRGELPPLAITRERITQFSHQAKRLIADSFQPSFHGFALSQLVSGSDRELVVRFRVLPTRSFPLTPQALT